MRWNEPSNCSTAAAASHVACSGSIIVFCLRAAAFASARFPLRRPDGDWFVGDVQNDLAHGRGDEYRLDGSIAASGEWIDGQLHGFGMRWDEGGQLKECGLFEEGKLVQTCAVPLCKIPSGALCNKIGEQLCRPAASRYRVDRLIAESRPLLSLLCMAVFAPS